MSQRESDSSASPGLMTVLASVFRAWFGVQSEAARARDFQSRSATPFIIAGVIFVVAMVLAVVTLVNLVT